MPILQLCTVAVVTAICAFVLKSQKSDLVPLCVTAGGILLILCGFDYLSESLNFIKQFSEQTNIDKSVLRIMSVPILQSLFGVIVKLIQLA